jgi:hypothetical protein
MKYLIQNKKEFAISVGFFVMTAINLVKSIRDGELTEDTIVAFVLAAFSLAAWYYNMPTSEENDRHTFLMRQEKAEQDPDYVGEKFFDGPEGEDDEEDEDQQETEESEADDEE